MALQMLAVAYGVRAGVVEMFTYAIFPIIAARLVLFVESGPSNDQCAIFGTLQVSTSYCCMGSIFAAPSISPDLARFNESTSQLQSKKFLISVNFFNL